MRVVVVASVTLPCNGGTSCKASCPGARNAFTAQLQLSSQPQPDPSRLKLAHFPPGWCSDQ
jgi:hypothetical protein